MGLGNYSFSALQTIQGITFRTLERFETTQIVETGLKVSRLIESIKKNNPDKVPKKPPSGLLDRVLPVNDFELALHLLNANDPTMAKIVTSAKGLPVMPAYISVLTNGAELLPEHLLESVLSYSNASLSVEAVVAKLWNENLQTELARLAPLASTGLKFKSGKPKGAFGPVALAVRKRLLINPKKSPDVIWQELSQKPPKGLSFYGKGSQRYVESEVLREPAKNGEPESALWRGLVGETEGGKQLVRKTTEWRRFTAIVREHRKIIENCTE